ncbi:MAG: hypothetical protein HZA93_02425 [Verrucomicrobia bacterium]|nr:hypothetical protein [Verrucomicrobiota bacterium]
MMHRNLKLFPIAGLGALVALGAATALAQTAPAPAQPAAGEAVKLDAYVVTGLRGSLASATEIKQSKMRLVDSIVASDIDKLPDINVAYAQLRVPGVQLAHMFSGLGGNGAVTTHDLNQIVNTIDGRKVITPGGIAEGAAGVGVASAASTTRRFPPR